ncbi:MAG TPA: type II CAAX endopeptidase family protein [Terriglobales bacterium]
MASENLQSGAVIPPLPQVGDIDDAFPVWTLWDVVKIAIIAIATLFFFSLLVLMVASGLPAFRATTMKELLMDARLAVLSQLLTYVATFWFVYRLIARHYSVPFAEGVHWRWPGYRAAFYLILGALFALVVQQGSRYLPIPRQMPINQLFKTPAAAWSLALFGTLIAPLAEELFFRGLLFPVLIRRIGLASGLVITSLLFALLHASQLGMAWAPVLILFLVGLMLTLVRYVTHSLATSTLFHVGYNAIIFVRLYAATDGFHHLERALQ